MKFTISMIPVAKGRVKMGRWGAYTPKKTVEAEAMIRQQVLDQMNPEECRMQPMTGALYLKVIFYMPIPKSLSKKKQVLLENTPHTKKPDLDNLIKTFDALNGILWADDSQICTIMAEKKWSKEGKIEIEVLPKQTPQHGVWIQIG